jgi:hypothetical protein
LPVLLQENAIDTLGVGNDTATKSTVVRTGLKLDHATVELAFEGQEDSRTISRRLRLPDHRPEFEIAYIARDGQELFVGRLSPGAGKLDGTTLARAPGAPEDSHACPISLTGATIA